MRPCHSNTQNGTNETKPTPNHNTNPHRNPTNPTGPSKPYHLTVRSEYMPLISM